MATPTHKSAAMNAFLDQLTGMLGQTRTNAITNDVCVSCNEDASTFKDALSEREYRISGLCQRCQDGVFGTSEDEE